MTKMDSGSDHYCDKFDIGSEVLNKEQALGGAATSKRTLAVVIVTRETLAPWDGNKLFEDGNQCCQK